MVPPERIPAAGRLRDHEYRGRYAKAGQQRHGVVEGAGVPIIEGEGGHPRKLLSTLDAFHEFAQAHDFVVPRQPAHLRLEVRERHMETGCGALARCAVRHDVVIAQNRPAAAQQTRGSRDSEGVQGDVEPGAEYAKSLHLPKRGQASYRPDTREWPSAPHTPHRLLHQIAARAPQVMGSARQSTDYPNTSI